MPQSFSFSFSAVVLGLVLFSVLGEGVHTGHGRGYGPLSHSERRAIERMQIGDHANDPKRLAFGVDPPRNRNRNKKQNNMSWSPDNWKEFKRKKQKKVVESALTVTCTVKGDPHITPFEGSTYGFPAKGEFVLFSEPNQDSIVTNCYDFQRASNPSYAVQSAFACDRDIIVSQANSVPNLPMDVFHFRFEGSASANNFDSNSTFTYVPTDTRADAFEAGQIACGRQGHSLQCFCNAVKQEAVYFKNHGRGYQILNIQVEAPAPVNNEQPYSGLCSLEDDSRYFSDSWRENSRFLKEKYASVNLIGMLADKFDEVKLCYDLDSEPNWL